MKDINTVFSIAAIALLSQAASLLGQSGSGGRPQVTPPPFENRECGDSGVQLIGFSDALNKTSFGEFGVRELSAIDFDVTTGTYRVVADRAGTTRAHTFDVSIPLPAATIEPVVTGSKSSERQTGLRTPVRTWMRRESRCGGTAPPSSLRKAALRLASSRKFAGSAATVRTLNR